ncbi:MAG: hypothetical protein A2428_01060 [Bdellovibrionales bacterium RIFOXYC1_FULL_54_43]|nr:MAG: hypothetical protein A2428_01060 [Bdellovibrionales bacterium RIFOXYC1_FULL_54_43]OFZ82873.1 MAG: hypothetical protein A2603_11780 [Bdellovibrionales bacterium RIFOXYD1_FULL_55_31]
MSIYEARARHKQLNAQISLKRREQKRLFFAEKAELLKCAWDGYLPQILTEEFESRYIFNPRTAYPRKSLTGLWRKAQKILLDLKIEPSEWHDQCLQFYD